MNQATGNTINAVDQDVKIDEDMAEVGTGIILAAATLVGLWSTTCMASAIWQYGLVAVAKGYFSAMAG